MAVARRTKATLRRRFATASSLAAQLRARQPRKQATPLRIQARPRARVTWLPAGRGRVARHVVKGPNYSSASGVTAGWTRPVGAGTGCAVSGERRTSAVSPPTTALRCVWSSRDSS
jgi:hypothetical protein